MHVQGNTVAEAAVRVHTNENFIIKLVWKDFIENESKINCKKIILYATNLRKQENQQRQNSMLEQQCCHIPKATINHKKLTCATSLKW